ncbi:MAG: C10 family peptidase, partial [Bacteroidales bacterium]|nr:C10 family peptidase [Bacteroidales bacterium]
MKKSLTFLMLMLCCIGVVLAKPVDSELAKKVALNFLKSTEKVAAADLTVEDLTDITTTTPFHEFYVFSIRGGSGFILISGDDCALPILGYSLNNPFISENMPEQVRGWFDTYEAQITDIRERGLEPNEDISSQWHQFLESSGTGTNSTGYSLGPLLSTTWAQGSPYNSQCPYHSGTVSCGSYTAGNDNTLVGCVATATAQVMRYWNWPTTGEGSHTNTSTTYGTQTVNFNTTYSWHNMPNSLSSSSSTTQINAVAKLAYHVGVACNMAYGLCGSSASNYTEEYALKTYFKYVNTLQHINKSSYTNANWLNAIKTELNNLRPVLYRGWSSESGGHVFVCDGYNSSDQLHFNWGWGGWCDGYFTIGALNPNGYDFNEGCYAIIGIRPNSSSTFYHIVAQTSPVSGGTITGDGAYTSGSTCTLTATASSGHQFVCWTEGDNIVSSNATYSFTVSSNRSLYAVFATCTEIPNYNYQITPAATWFSHTSSTSEASCYKKIYRLPLMSGVTYTFKTGCSNGATADFDTKLLLYDSSGSLITSNDDDSVCGNNLSRLVYTATYSGNAYLVVTGWNNHYGNYSLAYKKDCTGSNTDYNYTITPSLTSWYTHSGSTVNTCDGKIYRISVSPDYTYTFKTGCNDGATADFDTRLYLYNSSGDEMVSNDDDSECGNSLSRIVYKPTTSGYIYLRITGFAGATGTYTLAYKKECIDVPNYHYTLTPGTSWATKSGSNTGDCHRKIYRFSATANQPYVFKTGCGNNATADFDTYLEIFDADGNRLAYNDDNGCGNGQSKLDYTPTTSGYQYLVVRGYNDYTGSYTLAYRKLVARTITVAANPTAGGTVSISNTGTIYQGDQCTVTATPASGYAFVNWTVGGSAVSTSASYTFTVSTNITLTANFVRRYTITASANPTSGGTVTGGGTFNSGASCTLTATPAAGYVFTNWTSGSTVVSTNAVYTFTVSSNRTLKANFTPADSCPAITTADLPYTDNFDSYTTSTTAKTGVEPTCWTLAHQDVSMTDEYKPMVYYNSANAHSGSYSLLLNKRCIYAMPEFNGDVSSLQLS